MSKKNAFMSLIRKHETFAGTFTEPKSKYHENEIDLRNKLKIKPFLDQN